jgi:hypothetical protein
MVCRVMRLGDGTTAIVCGSRRRSTPCSVPGCGRPSTKLCDYPTAPLEFGKEAKTCDAKLCGTHATSAGPNTDYCPPHARAIATKGTPDR